MEVIKNSPMWNHLNSFGAIDDTKAEITWVNLHIEYDGYWDHDINPFFVLTTWQVYHIELYGDLNAAQQYAFEKVFEEQFNAGNLDVKYADKDIRRNIYDEAYMIGSEI